MPINPIHSFQLSMNEKGRTLFSARLRAAAKVDTKDELFAQVVGEGIILIETNNAVRNRVRGNAMSGANGMESTKLIRESRIEDVIAQQNSWEIRDRLAEEATKRSPEDVEAAGDAMLRAIGL